MKYDKGALKGDDVSRACWMRGALAGLTAVSFLLAVAMPVNGKPDVGLLPDMSFSVDCFANPAANFDDQVRQFMTGHGFQVVNEGRELRQEGAGVFPYNLTGIDDHDRIFSLVSFPQEPNHAAFSLFSRPPTRHDVKLEAAVQKFFSWILACGVSPVETHENVVEAQDIFEREVVRVRGLVRDGV